MNKVDQIVKTLYATLRFMVYLYRGGELGQEAKGTIAFYDTGSKQRMQRTFNHWDEVPAAMRDMLKQSRYVKRWKGKDWKYEK